MGAHVYSVMSHSLWPPWTARLLCPWNFPGKNTGMDRHFLLNGHEFEQALGVSDGQGSLACCSPWGCKESDTTEPLNWTEPHIFTKIYARDCSEQHTQHPSIENGSLFVCLKLTQHCKSTILQLKQNSKWIHCTLTKEYSVLMRMKELQHHATTWMNFKS